MKQILLFTLIALSFAANSQINAYAYYPFSGNANDASGNGNNGILHGQPTLTTDRLGNANSAYLFDGINDYVEMPEDFDFKPRTISLWFKPMAFTTEGVIFSSDHTGTQNADSKMVANENAGNYTLNLKIGLNPYVQTLTLNEWYHAAIVYSDTAIKYYVNGSLVGSYYNMANIHSGNGVSYATVGCHRGLINYFHGVIDEVIINDRALGADEILGTFTGLTDKMAASFFSYYPNPVNDKLYVQTEVPLHFNLSDMQGRVIKTLNISNSSTIDLSFVPAGTYCLIAEDKVSGIAIRRLVIKQ